MYQVVLDDQDLKFNFDTSGKLKLRDIFMDYNLFKSYSKIDDSKHHCLFKEVLWYEDPDYTDSPFIIKYQ